jgi:hypothetical protein
MEGALVAVGSLPPSIHELSVLFNMYSVAGVSMVLMSW